MGRVLLLEFNDSATYSLWWCCALGGWYNSCYDCDTRLSYESALYLTGLRRGRYWTYDGVLRRSAILTALHICCCVGCRAAPTLSKIYVFSWGGSCPWQDFCSCGVLLTVNFCTLPLCSANRWGGAWLSWFGVYIF